MRDRSAFLYLEPNPDTPEHAQCATCFNWLSKIERCRWLSQDFEVDSDDSCGFYIQGNPQIEGAPLGLITPQQAGFVDEKVRCENCNAIDTRDPKRIHCDFYVQLNRILPNLFNLEEAVKPHACCNAFEPGKRNPEQFKPYGPIPDEDDPKAGGILAHLPPQFVDLSKTIIRKKK